MAIAGADGIAPQPALTEACRPLADLLALASSRVTPARRGSGKAVRGGVPRGGSRAPGGGTAPSRRSPMVSFC